MLKNISIFLGVIISGYTLYEILQKQQIKLSPDQQQDIRYAVHRQTPQFDPIEFV